MIFDQFSFIAGQPVQGNITVNPFSIPGYPNGFPINKQVPSTPLDLLPDNEEKKKRRRKKLLKLMLISQLMNSQK